MSSHLSTTGPGREGGKFLGPVRPQTFTPVRTGATPLFSEDRVPVGFAVLAISLFFFTLFIASMPRSWTLPAAMFELPPGLLFDRPVRNHFGTADRQ